MGSPVVVLVGGSGFIGRKLAPRLIELGANVLVVGRAKDPEVATSARYHCADPANPGTLLPPDLQECAFFLVHLAWETERKEKFSVQADQVSYFASLLDYWGERGMSSVVVAGSSEEYGQRGGALAEGDTHEGILSAYGWGKLAARLLMQAWAEEAGIPALWLRPFIIYGPGQAGNMLIPYAVRQALSKSRADFTVGEQKRDFVFVDDIVEAFVKGLARQRGGFEEFNLGTGVPVTVSEVVQSLGELFGVQSLFRIGAIPTRRHEPSLKVANPSKAKRILGWEAKVDLKQGLRRIYESTKGSH